MRMDDRTSAGWKLRTMFAGGVFAAAFAGCVGLAQAQSDTGPIKIGVVYAKQGPFAVFGSNAALGVQYAAEQKGMKVLGRDVQIIWYDEADPNDAQQNMTKLIQQDKVVGIIGCSNSATALAMSDVANREKIPLICGAGSARELTGPKCNRYTFRSSFSGAVANKALGSYILSQGTNWYFLVANYTFGQDTYSQLKPILDEAGGTELGRDDIPLGTTDYSSFILKIRQANPEVVVAGLGGADYTNFLKQFAEYGLADKIKVANPFASDDYIWSLSPEAAIGIYTKSWHYDNVVNTPDEIALAEAWMEKHDRPASKDVWEGWISMRMLLEAIEAGQSTDAKSIVTQLETLKVDSGGPIPYYFRDWDHQMIKQVPVIAAHAAPAEDKWDMIDVLDNIPQDPAELDAFYGDKEWVGCEMGDF